MERRLAAILAADVAGYSRVMEADEEATLHTVRAFRDVIDGLVARHRAEHWVVVSGTARVTRGDEVFDPKADQSRCIPIGVKHRLGNPGPEPLRVIEIQSGASLGGDAIVRFDDVYGRTDG